MTIPGWRSSGFRPRPSLGINGVAPAGWNMATISRPLALNQKRSNGFSMKMDMPTKNARVISETTITHGKNSRSRSHLRSVTAVANADINHDQKISEPACPPHSAVIFRYSGMVSLVTL